ncbi:MAG: SEL1-like repeat protein [Candidatus Izemoplasmatales bacterium]|uniref:SEL1-like repeat protein n=1 Tax=Hujiaoplasma nucleasis TaxID=2725268 RepID=A0A7L6N457_9MOLU|nr:SEL1-like repeat protein [Hujiaoplasma nucleasis]QLY39775.1 SEL1-like repeat protein [Hujiaoplasma nucleasis]
MEALIKAKEQFHAKKYKESFSLFKNLSPDAEASYFLGLHYLHGLGVKQSDDKAFSYFKKSWEGLFHEGIYMLGMCYQEGIGVKVDLNQAFKLYQAARDSINAKIKLAQFYEEGIIVPKDLVKAIRLYNDCQKQGHAYAMYKIGRFYLSGEGLKQNMNQGYQWLQKALAENHVLAVNYFRMIGSKPSTDFRSTDDILRQAKSAIDKKQVEYAMSFLELAIKEESVEALMILVDQYIQGNLFEKDLEKAFKLLLKHQSLDHKDIDYRLAYFYEHGLGTVSSYYKAALFYEKAANKGHYEAKEALLELRGY